MSIATPEELKLVQKLISEGLVEKAPLMAMLEAQKQAYEQQKRQLSGSLFLLDLDVQELQVIDVASDEELDHLEFTEGQIRGREPWGSHYALVDEADGTHLASFEMELDSAYGLVLTENGAYVHGTEGLKADWLGYSQNCLYGGVLKGLAKTGPFDLTLSPDRELLAIANRGEGTLTLIDTRNFEERWQCSLRKPGAQTILNFTFNMNQNCAYVTDSQGSHIWIIDLNTGDVSIQKPGLGQLGNLVMAPDGVHLYLLVRKPNQDLLYVNTNDWSVSKQIKLKGDLFSNQSDDPCDLLALAPNQKHVLVMTYQNSPVPFTPVISVIDTDEVKTLRRYAIKDGSKPCQILFGRSNPLTNYKKKSLREMIVSAGLIDENTLTAVESGQYTKIVAPSHDPTQFSTPQEYIPPQPFVAPGAAMAPQSKSATKPSPRPESPPLPAYRTNVPESPVPGTAKAAPKSPKAPTIELGPESEELLQQMMRTAFEMQTGLSLQDSERAHQMLRASARAAREALETQHETEVNIPKLFEGRSLQTILRRRSLRLKQEESAYLKAHQDETVPFHCPACSQKLMSQWECPVCGFELENALRRFKSQIASAPNIALLKPGHILLPDPVNLRLLELNARKELVWKMDPDQISCEYPVDVVRMPGERLLVTDRQRNQIYILGLRGKIHWSLKTFSSPELELRQPVRATYFRPQSDGPLHYLIVDQGNHRVLEVDEEHRIHWSFGQQGEAGDGPQQLNSPSDIQYTPDRSYLICDADNGRVLEVNEHGQIEQHFDREGYDLRRPMFARRVWNGNTLIVDAEAHEIIEINPLGMVMQRLPYYRTGMPTDLRIVNPTGFIRMPNQDLVIFGAKKALQILPLQKKLIWHSFLTDIQELKAPAEKQTEKPQVQANDTPQIKIAEPQSTQNITKQTPLKPTNAKLVEANILPTVTPTRANVKRSRMLSPEERVQALIKKRSAPSGAHKESFEHPILYQRADTPFSKVPLFLLDQRHNSVLRINRKGKILWTYGFEMGQILSRPSALQVLPHSLILADTNNNRIMEVSYLDKDLVHTLNGPADSPLNHPRWAHKTEQGNFLIADQRNQRIIELTAKNEIVWEFKNDVVLQSPQSVVPLDDGSILVSDAMLNRVVQIDRAGEIQWYYGKAFAGDFSHQSQKLFGPTYAIRLDNNNTLIADTRNHRVLEVDLSGKTIWEYTGHAKNNRLNPTYAQRLENGNTLITFFNHSILLELTPENECIWSYSIGKDVFQPPVDGNEDQLVEHQKKALTSFYNAVEKRMINSAEQTGQKLVELHIELMDNVQMKSVRAGLIMMEVEQLGTVFKSFPPPEDLMADRFGKNLIISAMLDNAGIGNEIQAQIGNIAEVVSVQVVTPQF